MEAAGRRHHQQPKERPEQKPPATRERPAERAPGLRREPGPAGSSWVLALTSGTVREEVFVRTPALWCYVPAALGSQRRDEYVASI